MIFYTTGLHRDYHYVTDEVDKIEFAKMARVAELVHSTASRLGNSERAPARDFAGPGLEPDVIAEAHLDAASILAGVQRFAADRPQRIGRQRDLLAGL